MSGRVDLESIFPTPVGMVPKILLSFLQAVHFPHTRGDGPAYFCGAVYIREFSPHPWGWSAQASFPLLSRLIFPTPVGMVRTLSAGISTIWNFPHTRGDGPNRNPRRTEGGRFSPHPWGWSVGVPSLPRTILIFPTPVGMVRIAHTRPRWRVHFPHTRGDGPYRQDEGIEKVSFSPHPWGWSDAQHRRG